MISKLTRNYLDKAYTVGMRSDPTSLGKGRWSLHSYVTTEMKDSSGYGYAHPDSFQTLVDHLVSKNITLTDVNAYLSSYDWTNYIYFFPKTDSDAVMLKMILGDIKFEIGKPLYYMCKDELMTRHGDMW